MVAFDTNVVDLSEELDDPVDILFATQLGGGTDINQAVAYCQTLITRPADTIFVLLSDLLEGGLARRAHNAHGVAGRSGRRSGGIAGAERRRLPAYDHQMAAALASIGVAAFACTPTCSPTSWRRPSSAATSARSASDQGITTASTVGPTTADVAAGDPPPPPAPVRHEETNALSTGAARFGSYRDRQQFEHSGALQLTGDVLREHDRRQVGGRSWDGWHDRRIRNGEGVDPVYRAVRVGDRTRGGTGPMAQVPTG